MPQPFKIKFITLALFALLSCSKEDNKISQKGVWKVSKIVNKNCVNLTDNSEISYSDGCIPLGNINSCWELRIDEITIKSVWSEKNLSTGESDEYSEDGYYRISHDNSKFYYCYNEELSDCEDFQKIELSYNTLAIHFPEGYDVQNCYSVVTFVKQ